MRRLIALTALLTCTAASAAVDTAPEERFPEAEIRQLQPPSGPDEAVCRDRIHTVREERGLPALERETTDLEEPYFIAAVDHRIGDCSVMVMRHDMRDVRPIPKPDEKAPLLRPAR